MKDRDEDTWYRFDEEVRARQKRGNGRSQIDPEKAGKELEQLLAEENPDPKRLVELLAALDDIAYFGTWRARAKVKFSGPLKVLDDLRTRERKRQNEKRKSESTKTPGEVVVALGRARVGAVVDGVLQANGDRPQLFRLGEALVRPRLWDEQTGRVELEPLGGKARAGIIALAGQLERMVRFEENGEETELAADLVTRVATSPDLRLPLINGVTYSPFLAPDGTLIVDPGYNAAAQVWYAPPPRFDLPPVSENPTADEIAKARSLILDDVLGDFPFDSGAACANAVACDLLPGVRVLIEGPTPIHLYGKPETGTGGTLCADVQLAAWYGTPCAAGTLSGGEAEIHKTLISIFVKGEPVAYLDNVDGHVASAALEAATARTHFGGRILGASIFVNAPVRAMWVMTGNGPTFSKALVRRIVPITMDAGCEKPAERPTDRFRHPLLMKWVLSNRPLIMWARMTLLRAWVAAGRPLGKPAVPMGTFEAWAGVMAGILEVAGIPGFLGNVREFREHADPDSKALRELVEAWAEARGERWVAAKDVLETARAAGVPLQLGILENTSEPDKARAIALKVLWPNRGRIISGWRIEAADPGGTDDNGHRRSTKPNRWRLLRVGVEEEA
jgi:hypothetical protein